MKHYFPSFLNVDGRECLVIGNDHEAYDKASRLAAAGARVRLMAPSFDKKFEALNATLVRKKFTLTDLNDQFLVVLCLKENSDLTARVAAKCRAKRILLCAVDQPSVTDLANVSIYERGPLLISIFTSGVAPAISKKIRLGLESSLRDVPLETFFSSLAEWREAVTTSGDEYPVRREKLIGATKGFEFSAKVKLPRGWKKLALPPKQKKKTPKTF